MKIFQFIKANKYPIMVIAFFSVALLCIYFFIQGLKKDHSNEMFIQKMELKEESRKNLELLRSQYQQLYNDVSKEVLVKEITDSVKAANAQILQTKINNVQSKNYAKEKIAPVYNYTDTELSDFYNSLPDTRDNDYEQ